MRSKVAGGYGHMALGSAACIAAAAAIFGWKELAYFASAVLPRALRGETLDPYNPGNGSLSTLLRITFVTEPELNPHPLFNIFNAERAFRFLQPTFGDAHDPRHPGPRGCVATPGPVG